ncbi:MAG: hypothetical protein NZL88_02720 [Gaiellaceae bacterium]|nr:hypothetical protein [Gaiellaceae bacterium]
MTVARLAGLALGVATLALAAGPGTRTDTGRDVDPLVASAELERAAAPARAAAWCGTPADTDRTPNAIAGHPVRWVYAIPADGEDRIASIAPLMQADAEAVDAWWRREDPTRTPRNDLAPFPCGLQLDLSLLRLPQRSAEIPSGARFSILLEALLRAGLGSDETKVVVYYDGPAADPRTCGQGGSLRSGFGLAAVFVRACPGVSTAAVAAHELLHTFGAVPPEAPNACHGGHVCDSELDLMYPSTDDSPLETRLLDVGRDDYYRHDRPWPDARNVPWLVQLDRQAQLVLSVSGPGSVSADVPGLECSRPCTTTWNLDTRLQLRATPARGAKLVRWGGACAGMGACSVVVGSSGPVSALFAPASYRLAVRVAGRGLVRSASGRALACRGRCLASVPSHVPLRLVAVPEPGWRLRSWSGACRGSRATCTVPMTRATAVSATFVRARR